MNDITCPYCGAEQDINHDDGYGYEEGVLHQQNCVECDKIFGFETSISFYYEATATPCLNDDAPHDYKLTNTYPVQYARMECTVCGEKQ